MIKKIAIVLGLLVAGPVFAGECFNFESLFLSDESEEQVAEKLSNFRGLLNEFFYIKGEQRDVVPEEISWDTARELVRFLDQEGLEIRLREDILYKERESFYSIVVGAALIGGYVLGTYGNEGIKRILTNFIRVQSRKAQMSFGLVGASGAVFTSWWGKQFLPEGSCQLSFNRSFMGDAVPLKNLSINDFKSNLETAFEDHPLREVEAVTD